MVWIDGPACGAGIGAGMGGAGAGADAGCGWSVFATAENISADGLVSCSGVGALPPASCPHGNAPSDEPMSDASGADG